MLRKLRNEMILEYMEDPGKWADALNTGHEHVITLTEDAKRILTDLKTRGWIDTEA